MQKAILFAMFIVAVSVLLSGCAQPAMYLNTNTGPIVNPQNQGTNETVNSTVNVSANTSIAPATGRNSSCQRNSVYFIHADWCPHCQRMAPWVADLGTQGYKFVSVTTETLATHKDCLIGVAKMQYIPEFVCLSTSQSHVGEFTDENALKAFADACGAGSQ